MKKTNQANPKDFIENHTKKNRKKFKSIVLAGIMITTLIATKLSGIGIMALPALKTYHVTYPECNCVTLQKIIHKYFKQGLCFGFIFSFFFKKN